MKHQSFIEDDCTIEHEGKKFTNGGSYLVDCTDGIRRGYVYVNDKNRNVTTWHGEPIAPLDTATKYNGNFCTMRRVSFTVDGVKYVGDYCPDWADGVRVRSTKKVS